MSDEITWRRRGAVLVAVPTPPLEPPPRASPVPRPAIVDMIACPTCHARVGDRCRTRAGKPAKRAHSNRLVPRLCPCGAVMPWHRKFWCDTCVTVAQRKAQREYAARRRARERGAA